MLKMTVGICNPVFVYQRNVSTYVGDKQEVLLNCVLRNNPEVVGKQASPS